MLASNSTAKNAALPAHQIGNKESIAAGLAEQVKSHLSEALRWFKPYRDDGALKNVPLECYPSLITGPVHDYARLWLSGRVKTPLRAHREVFAGAAWNALKT